MCQQTGSLFHIKDNFNFRALNLSEPDHSVHDWMEFVTFATDGYLLLLYMKLENATSLEKIPKDLPDDDDGKAAFLAKISEKMVEAIWPKTREDIIKKIAESARKEFCLCKQFKGRSISCIKKCTIGEGVIVNFDQIISSINIIIRLYRPIMFLPYLQRRLR